MERLTKRMCGGFGVMPGCELNTAIGAKAVVDRLAAYEDTGLEPEEVKEFLEDVESRFVLWINKRYGIPAMKFMDIMQAEKDGRLVVLPCKVGDTVYIIRGKKMFIATVEAIHQWISGMWKLSVHTDKRYTHWVGYEVSFDDFGKTVFLTREEAEAALKKKEMVEPC